VILTRDIAMPRVTHRDLTRGIFIFIFKKIKRKILKFKKNQKNHILTRDMLVNFV